MSTKKLVIKEFVKQSHKDGYKKMTAEKLRMLRFRKQVKSSKAEDGNILYHYDKAQVKKIHDSMRDNVPRNKRKKKTLKPAPNDNSKLAMIDLVLTESSKYKLKPKDYLRLLCTAKELDLI